MCSSLLMSADHILVVPIHFLSVLILKNSKNKKSLLKSFMNKSYPESNVQMKHNAVKRQAAPIMVICCRKPTSPDFKGFKQANSVKPFRDKK